MNILGIPKKDLWPVSIYVLTSGFVLYICLQLFPEPIHVLVYAWYVAGQGILVKYKATSQPYQSTFLGVLLGAFMAFAWPLFCRKTDK